MRLFCEPRYLEMVRSASAEDRALYPHVGQEWRQCAVGEANFRRKNAAVTRHCRKNPHKVNAQMLRYNPLQSVTIHKTGFFGQYKVYEPLGEPYRFTVLSLALVPPINCPERFPILGCPSHARTISTNPVLMFSPRLIGRIDLQAFLRVWHLATIKLRASGGKGLCRSGLVFRNGMA